MKELTQTIDAAVWAEAFVQQFPAVDRESVIASLVVFSHNCICKPVAHAKHSEKEVWILYSNKPGEPGTVMGLFSSPDLAKNCDVLSEEVFSTQWIERDDRWVIHSGQEKYFTIELSTIDRLA